MYLIIAEKPSVRHIITKILGADKREDGYCQSFLTKFIVPGTNVVNLSGS